MARRMSQNPQSAMVKWAQDRLQGQGIEVKNLTTSWQNGQAFCALVNHFAPDCIPEYNSLVFSKENSESNLNLAFASAKKAGIENLLDAEDILEEPDSKSIYTYLTMFHQVFEGSGDGMVGSRLSGSGGAKANRFIALNPAAARIKQTGGLQRSFSEPAADAPKATVDVGDKIPAWKKKLAGRKQGDDTDESSESSAEIPKINAEALDSSTESLEEKHAAPAAPEPATATRRPSKSPMKLPMAPASAQLRLSARQEKDPKSTTPASAQQSQNSGMVSPRGRTGVPSLNVGAVSVPVLNTAAAAEAKPMSYAQALTSPRSKAAAESGQMTSPRNKDSSISSPRNKNDAVSPRGNKDGSMVSPRGAKDSGVVSPRGQNKDGNMVSPRNNKQDSSMVSPRGQNKAVPSINIGGQSATSPRGRDDDDDAMISPRSRQQRRVEREKQKMAQGAESTVSPRLKKEDPSVLPPKPADEDAAERKRRIDAAVAEYKRSRALQQAKKDEEASAETPSSPLSSASTTPIKPESPAERWSELEERKKRLSQRRSIMEKRGSTRPLKITVDSGSSPLDSPISASAIPMTSLSPISALSSSMGSLPSNSATSDLQLQLDELRSELQRVTLERDRFELQVKVANQMKEVAVKNSEWTERDLSAKLEQLNAQLSQAKNEAQSSKESQKSTMEFAKAEMARVMEEATRDRKELQSSLDSERRAAQRLKSDLEEALQKVKEAKANEEVLSEKLAKAGSGKDGDAKALREAKREADNLREELKEGKELMDQLKSDLAKLKNQNGDLETDIRKKNREINEVKKQSENELDAVKDQMSALKKENSSALSQLKKRIEELEDENRDLKKSKDSSKDSAKNSTAEFNSESSSALSSAIDVLQSLQKVKVKFSWNGSFHAKEVFLRGNFDDWSTPHQASLGPSGGKAWEVELELYPGVYQYKFVVDGEYMLATDKPTVLLNHQGAVNNVKIVKGQVFERSDRKLTQVLKDLLALKASFQ